MVPGDLVGCRDRDGPAGVRGMQGRRPGLLGFLGALGTCIQTRVSRLGTEGVNDEGIGNGVVSGESQVQQSLEIPLSFRDVAFLGSGLCVSM